jgi:hypothetical protein
MDVKIDKERFNNILMKLFNSMIGRIHTREDTDGNYIELFDKNGDMFADIWLKGSSVVPKRCKKFLNLHTAIMAGLGFEIVKDPMNVVQTIKNFANEYKEQIGSYYDEIMINLNKIGPDSSEFANEMIKLVKSKIPS